MPKVIVKPHTFIPKNPTIPDSFTRTPKPKKGGKKTRRASRRRNTRRRV